MTTQLPIIEFTDARAPGYVFAVQANADTEMLDIWTVKTPEGAIPFCIKGDQRRHEKPLHAATRHVQHMLHMMDGSSTTLFTECAELEPFGLAHPKKGAGNRGDWLMLGGAIVALAALLGVVASLAGVL